MEQQQSLSAVLKSPLKSGSIKVCLQIIDTQSTLMDDSLDVMGWDVKDNGLYVVFSKSIPSLVENWLEPNVTRFLEVHELTTKDIHHFIAHPGGKKVITAYEKALQFLLRKQQSLLRY